MTADLIARLEAGPGSRELDAEVWATVCTVPDFTEHGLAQGWEPRFEAMEDGSVTLYAVDQSETWQKRGKRPAPYYTTSLDAALTLVPEGWGIQVKLTPDKRGFAKLFDSTPYPNVRKTDTVEAANPALAASAASLRAMKEK